MVRRIFWIGSFLLFAIVLLVGRVFTDVLWSLCVLVPLFLLGLYDILQRDSNILRLYPIVGHLRYMLLSIRPQIHQYFIEDEEHGKPFSHEDRYLVYARSEKVNDTLPFGTLLDVYAEGYESINHSLHPKKVDPSEARIMVGNHLCKKPYHASRFNISAMSFGSISKNAVRALNRGAKLGNFAHNTGEGGLSDYHLQEGGDITWQIGTGYFGCRTLKGDFDKKAFQMKSQHPNIKMIELKLSQGAKPAHGGILPAIKISEEISRIRGVPMGEDCISPPAHSTFSTPKGLLEFIAKLRELCGGKPVGFKLCLGRRVEFHAICKAMLELKIYPDFITVDGSEGGTGAAPMEFIDFVGVPLNEGLYFIHNSLVGANLREHIRVVASGKIITGFDMLTKMALGSDICNSARGMMFALGCVQSRRCHTNLCPTGVTTQKPERVYALNIDNKAPRVRDFHDATVSSFLDLLGAAGLERVKDLTSLYVFKRQGNSEVKHYDEIFPPLKPGQLLSDGTPNYFTNFWRAASPEHF